MPAPPTPDPAPLNLATAGDAAAEDAAKDAKDAKDAKANRSLLARTARGASWVIVWRMATRLLGVVSTLTLVRLLAPADFGVVALGTSFAQAIEAFGAIGVEEAVIRERAPTKVFYDTAFTLNILRNLAIALVVALAAIPAGRFFNEPRMGPILLALAANYVIDGFSNIGVVEFRRSLAFEKEFLLLIVPRIAGICATIATAFLLHSYVALIVGIMTQRFLKVGFGYRMHPYRPRVTLKAWRGLIGYSLWTWALTVLEMARDRSDSILIGRMLNTTKVGVYNIGFEVAALSSTELVEPLSRAAFSSFAEARHTGLAVGETFLRIVSSAFLVTMPAGVGIALVANPLVHLAFGPLWVDSIPVIRILGPTFSVSVFGVLGFQMLSAHGRLGSIFRIMFLGTVIRVATIGLLIPGFGLIGAAIGVAVSTLAEQALYIAVTFRQFGTRLRDLVAHIWRSVIATGVMAGVLLATGYGEFGPASRAPISPAVDLFAAAAIGALVYAASAAALWAASGRPDGAEDDIIRLLRRLLGRLLGRLAEKLS